VTTIFDSFSQADVSTTRKYGGTGLGLSISKRLTELMGGEIRVVSEVGRGSEFSFVVPLTLGPDVAAPLRERPPQHLRGTRVLVVDDNATNRRIVREMLGAAGLVTDEARGADEAIERLRGADPPYELLVIDSHMPGRDGFDLAAQIRTEPGLAAGILLMLTSGGKRGDAQRCRELGIRGYLTKPVSEVELLEAVAAVLSTQQGPAAAADVITRYSIEEARRRLRLLLAEDNPVNQEVAAAMLRKRGHQVDIVGNGRAAVEAVTGRRYDLVLMDIQMPELDGFGATQAIRALPEGKGLRIVALTAHAAGDERGRCLAAGMDGYLSKPFKAHQLYAIVEGWAEVQVALAPTSQLTTSVDLEGFRDTMREAGADNAVNSILTLFAVNTPARISALATAVAAGDGAEIAQAAHAFKSAAGGIHAHALARELEAIELAGKAGDVGRASEGVDRVRGMADAVLACLRSARDGQAVP
jgi:CheY-like chemotaxis protein